MQDAAIHHEPGTHEPAGREPYVFSQADSRHTLLRRGRQSGEEAGDEMGDRGSSGRHGRIPRIDGVHRVAAHELRQQFSEGAGVVEQVEPDDAVADGEHRTELTFEGSAADNVIVY